MRYWIAGIVLSMGSLSVWLLPPNAEIPFQTMLTGDYSTRDARSPQREEARRLVGELRTAKRRLDYLALLEEIATLNTGDDDKVVGAWVGENEHVASEQVDAFVTNEAAAFGIEEPAARIGSIFMTAGPTEEGLPQRGFGSNTTLVVTRELGDPYCFVVSVGRPNRGLRAFGGTYEEVALGPCAFYGRYGAPGTEILGWLRAGAFELGQIHSPGDAELAAVTAQMIEREGRQTRAAYRRVACSAGRLEICEQILLMPLDMTPLTSRLINADAEDGVYRTAAYLRMYNGLGHRGHALLADLRSEFGDDAFQAYWSSDQPVTAAFSSAFGVSVGEWVHTWVRTHYPTVDPGPAPTGKEGLLAALWLGLFFVTSVRVVSNRGRTGVQREGASG